MTSEKMFKEIEIVRKDLSKVCHRTNPQRQVLRLFELVSVLEAMACESKQIEYEIKQNPEDVLLGETLSESYESFEDCISDMPEAIMKVFKYDT